MINILYGYMKSISKRGSQVISEIEDRDMIIFTPKDVRRFLGTSRDNTYRIIQNMEDKGLIRRIERGKYILESTLDRLDIYEIVPEIFQPSYIAYWSALHHHDMTEQVPRTVFLATTKRKKPLSLQGQKIRYVTIQERFFFGYERYEKVIVSDREKTLIDCLRNPRYAGGISHIFESIPLDLDTERLIRYCEMIDSSAVASRLGYMLERKGIQLELKSIIDTYTKLDPEKEMSGLDERWKLYINRRLG